MKSKSLKMQVLQGITKMIQYQAKIQENQGVSWWGVKEFMKGYNNFPKKFWKSFPCTWSIKFLYKSCKWLQKYTTTTNIQSPTTLASTKATNNPNNLQGMKKRWNMLSATVIRVQWCAREHGAQNNQTKHANFAPKTHKNTKHSISLNMGVHPINCQANQAQKHEQTQGNRQCYSKSRKNFGRASLVHGA